MVIPEYQVVQWLLAFPSWILTSNIVLGSRQWAQLNKIHISRYAIMDDRRKYDRTEYYRQCEPGFSVSQKSTPVANTKMAIANENQLGTLHYDLRN